MSRAVSSWRGCCGSGANSLSQLVNALATLGEYPLIRYYNPPNSFHAPLGPALAAGEHVGKRLAHRLQAELDAYARDNNDFPVRMLVPWRRGGADYGTSPYRIRPDLAASCSSPIAPWTFTRHSFTSSPTKPCATICWTSRTEQSTSAPFGPSLWRPRSRSGVCSYAFRNAAGTMEEKEAILTDDDKVWTEIRHMHMKDALDKLVADFKAYAGDHNGQFGSEGCAEARRSPCCALLMLCFVGERASTICGTCWQIGRAHV